MDLLKLIFVLPMISVMSISCFATQKSGKTQIGEVTCNNFGITTHILNLENGFKGIVYAEKHFLNPVCRYNGHPESNGSISLFFPANNCGTRVQELDDYIYFSNTIVIQKHFLAETVWDVFHKVSCKIDLPRTPNLNEILKDDSTRSYIHQPHGIESWMEFKVGSDILSSQAVNVLRVGDVFLLVVHLKDGGKHNNLRVTECWAHDGATVDSSIYSIQIFNTCQSSDFITEFTSAKGIFNVSDMVTYAKLNAFMLPSVVNVQFSCSIKVCRNECLGYCDASDSGKNNHTVPTRKLNKRSTNGDFSSRSMDERIRLMKATIKALSAKLLNNRSQRNSENDSSFSKRVSNPLTKDLKKIDEVTEMAHEKDAVTTTVVDILKLGYSDSGSEFAATSEVYFRPAWNDEHHFNLTNSIIILSSRESNLSYDVQHISGPTLNCVSRLRFSLVTAMLCSLLFCVILKCIGLALYLRKEKKKHLIDSFLLYNFY